MAEFLPICDVLFNVISLAGYFCDVVFDVVLSYALFERGRYTYFTLVITLVIASLIISQIVSLRWHFHKLQKRQSALSAATDSIDKKKPITAAIDTGDIIETKKSKFGRNCVIVLHCTQLGVLWRYAKLFVPVDLRHVKHEVRDLCMLRLVHAFCEAAPMLLLQSYILVTIQQEEATLLKPEIPLQSLGSHVTPIIVQQPTAAQQHQLRTFKDLNIVSCALSLFSVAWALASFSKNVRIQNVHRLVLTWLGVIFQFFWRLGTVIARVASLTVYASVYNQWVFLVITLHWMSMFFWLISPKNVFHGERISRIRKTSLAGLIAFVYVFAYINLQEVNHRQKMITFYVVMFLENSLLVFLWVIGIWHDRPDNWYNTPILIFFSFITGIFFMVIYYRYFHVRRLGYETGINLSPNIHKYSTPGDGNCLNINNNLSGKGTSQIPGVFSCRFSNPVGNGATRRKKKKPTSFVPPPNLNMHQIADPASTEGNENTITNTGFMLIPFWRRPITRSQTGGSENEGSAGSRVDIHQKLQEKKEKQLAELKIIEEEIKQGKLVGPGGSSISGVGVDHRASLPRQPIPNVKKHINLDPQEMRPSSPEIHHHTGAGSNGCNSNNSETNIFNDLNILSSNIDSINNLNKYSRNYDPMYNEFGLDGINIPVLEKESGTRNMSPISSQTSGTDSNSMKCTKMPYNPTRNPFAENYRPNFANTFGDNFIANEYPSTSSISPRNATNSPNRMANNTPVSSHYDHNNFHLKHPRQISGTYSNSLEKNGTENLSFPYNVIPPPKSKLDSRSNVITPQLQLQTQTAQPQQSAIPTPPIANSHLSIQQRLKMQRSKTPEILLAPHYLDNSRVYYEWVARDPIFRLQQQQQQQQQQQHQQQQQQQQQNVNPQALSSGDENIDDNDNSALGCGQNGYRIPSDIDSQVSLPRSYTLPREFKYYRQNKGRKLIKNEHFITSTNSSDGDVSSGDDNESDRHSGLSSSNSSQRLPTSASVTPNPLVTNDAGSINPTLPSTSINATYRAHMVGPVAASPLTVSNVNAAIKLNKNSPSTTPLITSQNLFNNLHILNSAIGSGDNSNSNQLPNMAFNIPNYLNITANNNIGTNNIARHSNTPIIFNGNLESMNGGAVEGHSTAMPPVHNRQRRIRGYGNGKNGMVRHETKL